MSSPSFMSGRSSGISFSALATVFCSLLIVFLGSMWFLSRELAGSMEQQLTSEPLPGVPAKYDRAYHVEGLELRELFLPHDQLSIRIGRIDHKKEPFPNNHSVLLDVRRFRMKGMASEVVSDRLLKYASANFDSRRAIPKKRVPLEIAGVSVTTDFFETGKGRRHAIGVLNQEDHQTIFLATTRDRPIEENALRLTLENYLKKQSGTKPPLNDKMPTAPPQGDPQ